MPRRPPSLAPLDAPPQAHQSPYWDGALTVAEARRMFGVSRSRLFLLMRAGALEWSRPGKHRLISRSSLVRYLDRHRGLPGRVDLKLVE